MENENLNAQNKCMGVPSMGTEIIDAGSNIPVRDSVFAWAAYVLSFIFTHYCVPYFGGLWGGIFWACFGIFIAVYARLNGVKFTKFHAFMLGAAELFCLTPLFSANRFVCFLAAVYSFALYFYLMIAVTGADAFGRHFVIDFFRSLLIRPFESFVRQPVSAFSVFKGKKRTKNVLYALIGLVLSIPLTVVVVLLLASSDERFGNVMLGVLNRLPEFSFKLIWELLFAVPIAMYLFGAAYSIRKSAPVNHEGAPEYRFLPPVISYFAVSPICVFYLIYVIVQVGNIADALGKNIGYSDFARQGFFELCAIAVINLIVIVALQTFCKRKENDVKPLVLRVYSVMISAFTLMIIATALTKMFMYIGQYGMTLMRVYTSWFMILLALIFISVIVLQIRDYPIWKTLFAIFTVMFMALCFGNFEGNIAAYNIKAYQSGAIETLDVDQFEELGAAAVSPAYRLYSEHYEDDRLHNDLEELIESECEKDRGVSRSAYFSIPRAKAWIAFDKYNDMLEARSNPKEFMRIVVNVDSSAVYDVELEYLLDGEPMGGKGIRLAEGGNLRRGERLIFKFYGEDFPTVDELSGTVGVRFRVTNKNNEPIKPDIPEIWANSSESYDGTHYTLSKGVFENGTPSEPTWEWKAERGGVYEFQLTDNVAGGFYLFPLH